MNASIQDPQHVVAFQRHQNTRFPQGEACGVGLAEQLERDLSSEVVIVSSINRSETSRAKPILDLVAACKHIDDTRFRRCWPWVFRAGSGCFDLLSSPSSLVSMTMKHELVTSLRTGPTPMRRQPCICGILLRRCGQQFSLSA